MDRPFEPVSAHCCAAGAPAHARGRFISSTKVKALPKSLGQCKLLQTLCVPPPDTHTQTHTHRYIYT